MAGGGRGLGKARTVLTSAASADRSGDRARHRAGGIKNPVEARDWCLAYRFADPRLRRNGSGNGGTANAILRSPT